MKGGASQAERKTRSGYPFARVLIAGTLLLAAGSCAYYNTFYLAQKYYNKATAGKPYAVDQQAQGAQINDYRKSVEYSKKVLSQYADSKWVDDAYLLWARALLGQNDPLKTVEMLEVFPSRFPKSDLLPDAVFYLGVGYRQARRYPPAVLAFDRYFEIAPKHDMVPYAYLERARALVSLERYDEASRDATQIIEKYSNSGLLVQAYTERAEARLAGRDYDAARADFKYLGQNSRTDEERLNYLLREADCLESARDFDAELKLLNDALSYEIEPVAPDTGATVAIRRLPGWDRYGRILMRVGTAHALAGDTDAALDAYQRIVQLYPKTALGGEAQYRIGYLFETIGDDFERARGEYEKVREHAGATGFGLQAHQRLQNLQRIEQYRAEGDSTGDASEAGFLLAEQYLFQLEKPDRALEEYRRIADQYAGRPAGGKAMVAQAYVLRHYMEEDAEADSLLWEVVYDYSGTEAQVAARDYLERRGYEVDPSLIKLPEPPPPPPPPVVPADTTIGIPLSQLPDSAGAVAAPPDSLIQRLQRITGSPDSVVAVPAPVRDTVIAVTPDTTSFSPPADTTGTAPRDTTRASR